MLALFALIGLHGATHAAQWRVTPRVNLTETYTDNLRLAPKGAEQSDWVTQIDPGVAIRATGARLQLDVNYALQYRLYANNSGANGHNHALRSKALLDAWNRQLFLDASASIAQQNLSPLSPQGQDNINLTGNRVDVRRVSLSPYWNGRLGSFARLQARYGWDRIESGGAASALDTESHRGTLELASGPQFRDLGWTATYRKEQINSTGGQFQRRDLENLALEGRFRVHPTFSVIGTLGSEHNSYGSLRGSTSGTYWDAGAQWAPSARTNVTAKVGERFFGRSLQLNAQHRTRLTVWTLGYSDQIIATPARFGLPESADTTTAIDQLLRSRIPDPIEREQAVQEFIRQNGLPLTLDTPLDFLTNRVTLSKRLHAGFGLRGVRGTLLLNAYRERRSSEGTASAFPLIAGDPFAISDTVEQTGYSASLSWRLTERTVARMSGGQSISNYVNAGREDTSTFVRAGITHQLQPKIIGTVDLRRTERDTAGAAAANYRENAIIGTLGITF